MKKRGFTIAEILMTMAILGFVVALSVPMLGQQKMRKPNYALLGHGLFECYYDDAGQLTQHLIDEKGNDTVEHVNNVCTFSTPEANYFAITTVGAGGDGGYLDQVPSFSVVPSPDVVPRNISTGPDFQQNLKDLPKGFQWVHEFWDTAAPRNPITYKIQGAVGDGGKSSRLLKALTIKDYPICIDCLTTGAANCDPICYDYTPCPGGSSFGYNYTIRNVQLNHDAQVAYNYDVKVNGLKATVLNIGNGSAVVYDGPDGENADIIQTRDYEACVDGESCSAPKPSHSGFEFCPRCIFVTSERIEKKGAEKTTEHPRYLPIAGEKGYKASISATPAYIKVAYDQLQLRINYGTHGEPGTVITRTYEKLPATQLKMRPAASTDEETEVYMLNAQNQKKYLSKTVPGANGANTSKKVTIETENDLPIPIDIRDEVHTDAQNSIASAVHSKKSYIEKLNELPGVAGSGAYPVITSVKTNLKRYIGRWTGRNISIDLNANDTTCLNGTEPIGDGNSKYCSATRGGKGAIIIEW